MNVNAQPMLAVDTCEDMGLIKRITSLEADKKRAIIKKKQPKKEELGLIAENYHIHVNPGVKG